MKKKIIAGIDFSDCSINALEHAISIANKAEADLVMIWVNKPDANKEFFTVEKDKILEEANQRFEHLADLYKPQLKGGKLEYVIRKGKVYREICNLADEIDAFLIIVGTHGSSGFEEFWIGSNANRIVSSTHRPIITIRGGVDVKRNLKRIILPLDSTLETRQKVPFTTLMAKYFNAEVHILGLLTTTVRAIHLRIDNYIKQVETYLDKNHISYTTEMLETGNIASAIIEYAQKTDANLISIMTEMEKTTSNLWLGPYAAQLVNHSPIPILSLHPDEYMVSLSR